MSPSTTFWNKNKILFSVLKPETITIYNGNLEIIKTDLCCFCKSFSKITLYIEHDNNFHLKCRNCNFSVSQFFNYKNKNNNIENAFTIVKSWNQKQLLYKNFVL